MKETPGVDYTPVTVAVFVSVPGRGITKYKGFTTNTDKGVEKLMDFVRKHVEGGSDVRIVHH